jgi:hypothetical protein
MSTKCQLFASALVVVLFAVPSIDAAITPTLIAVVPNIDGSFTYTYNVDIDEDQNAMNDGAFPSGPTTPTGPGEPGSTFQDYFTIYDFAGLYADSWTQPEGWTFGVQFVGPTGSTVGPSDDPGLLNIYWVRTGEDLAGPQDVGNFTVRSVFGLVVLDSYTSDATRNQGSNTGTAVANIGPVYVPATAVCGITDCVRVTEPAAVLLLAGGLLGLGILRSTWPLPSCRRSRS